jgi:hypothetical protein
MRASLGPGIAILASLLLTGCSGSIRTAERDAGPPPDLFPPRRDGGPIDASVSTPTDAGPPDAGPPDAGPPDARVCGASGSCHPLFDADCGCQYSETSFDYACGRSGSSRAGGACDTPADCAAGLTCSRFTNDARGQCRPLCDEDADCGAGEGCAMLARLSISCAGLCLPLSECSVLAQNCAGDEGCYWVTDSQTGREHTFCNREGTAEPDDLCFDDPTACGRGYLCARFISIPHCDRACDEDADCASFERCRISAGGVGHCD